MLGSAVPIEVSREADLESNFNAVGFISGARRVRQHLPLEERLDLTSLPSEVLVWRARQGPLGSRREREDWEAAAKV